MGNKLFTKPPIVSSEPEITEEEIETLTYIGFTDQELKELGYIESSTQEEIEALTYIGFTKEEIDKMDISNHCKKQG